jgi:hypothetical protein
MASAVVEESTDVNFMEMGVSTEAQVRHDVRVYEYIRGTYALPLCSYVVYPVVVPSFPMVI